MNKRDINIIEQLFIDYTNKISRHIGSTIENNKCEVPKNCKGCVRSWLKSISGYIFFALMYVFVFFMGYLVNCKTSISAPVIPVVTKECPKYIPLNPLTEHLKSLEYISEEVRKKRVFYFYKNKHNGNKHIYTTISYPIGHIPDNLIRGKVCGIQGK